MLKNNELSVYLQKRFERGRTPKNITFYLIIYRK